MAEKVTERDTEKEGRNGGETEITREKKDERQENEEKRKVGFKTGSSPLSPYRSIRHGREYFRFLSYIRAVN